MKQAKDLSWLGAPAFFLIVGLIAFAAKKQTARSHPEKIKSEVAVSYDNSSSSRSLK